MINFEDTFIDFLNNYYKLYGSLPKKLTITKKDLDNIANEYRYKMSPLRKRITFHHQYGEVEIEVLDD